MKSWFPFTDYEFYSYLSCGLLLMFGLDIWGNDGAYLLHDDWTFIQGALVIALAFVLGQVISIPSSIILEHCVVRKILRPPAFILISGTQNKAERFIEKFLIGRHYSPLPRSIINKIFMNATSDTGLSRHELEGDVRAIFIAAIHASRNSTEVTSRISFFRNQYSFARNISFTGVILTILFFEGWVTKNFSLSWSAISLLITLAMFIRFLKFYSCCATEVLTSYAWKN